MSTPQKQNSSHSYATQLTSNQRAKLKGAAHALRPLVQVGNSGISAPVAAEIASALQTHEIIKVKLAPNTDATEKDKGTEELEKILPPHSFVVSRIGRTVILYHEKDPSLAKNPLKSL